jgi:Lysyl oxidase/Bacterial Ig domain
MMLLVGVVAIALTALAPAGPQPEAHASSPTPQLPNLVADPPDNVSIAVSKETVTGEPAEEKLLLRFNGYLHNKGPGALDFRGKRTAPPDPENLASPPMQVFQRVYEYESTEGPPPTSETTPHKEVSSAGKMEYVKADGHNHWHLQHVAAYSLWNAQKSAQVAPSQKVGFCLEDSEHVENIGPEQGVYVDYGPHPREFCRQLQPEATEVFEGISEGWRDVYDANLAFQWVDVSNVLPGEYWLQAEVNPEHYIDEVPGASKPPAYAVSPTIIPGFDSEAQSRSVEIDRPLTVTLTSRRWAGNEPFEQPSALPTYTIVTPPEHGTLGALTVNRVQYTPANGYSGTDSFTFAASDPNSSFPKSPAIATVSINVSAKPSPPSVAIEGAPTSMIAGTSVQLSALVSNDTPNVKWSASAGSIASTGSSSALYTAPAGPPAGNQVTVSAESPNGGHDQRTIEIQPIPTPEPKPEAPPESPSSPLVPPTAGTPPSITTPATPTTPGTGGSHAAGRGALLLGPGAMLIGRKLYMTATAEEAGRLRLTAVLRGQRIGSCLARVRSHQSFTCATTLPRAVSSHAPIAVWATLRVGSHLTQAVRRAAPVPSAMKAKAAISWRGVKQAWRFFCGM